MVSISIANDEASVQLVAGLSEADAKRVLDALEFVRPLYSGNPVATGQDAFVFSESVAVTLASLKTDAETRIAGLLFELPMIDASAAEQIGERFGTEIADLVGHIRQLMRLHEMTFGQHKAVFERTDKSGSQQAAAQVETLRKMLLAMASDMRVVLVRLASRLTTLRYFADNKLQNERTCQYARETFDLYAPLANRLGVWQLKWELEDLSFRFLEPQTYKRIASMLEEKRLGREHFVNSAIERLKSELAAAGIKAEVTGRPKHIYSIWNKMRGKSLEFSELYDVRAFRVIVEDIKTCYAVLGIVHNIWAPIPKEFDDYISRPKANGYRSLHTVVLAEDGRPLEVQVRTSEMHHFAEYGVAAHWRYKESPGSAGEKYDAKIAWLRQLLAWKSEVVDAVVGQEEVRRDWVEKLKAAALDDRIYVLTPQARVIELPSGATPIDFAYHLHSDVGHRCRGAKVDGAMVPLNTALKNGQTVEIITAKGEVAASGAAGPSRDWLSADYAVSSRTRAKIRAWFNAIDQQETLNSGRSQVEKTLQREGKTSVNLEDLAHKLGFAKLDDFFLAIGKETFSLRQVEQALHAEDGKAGKPVNPDDAVVPRKSRASSVTQGAKSGVLVVGTEGLLTQLARCCKPAPPDEIVGFVTRGKGVSIHRAACKNFAAMEAAAPERVIATEWGLPAAETVYPVDLFILASDRQGLLRDISEILLRDKINVIGMAFTAEITSTAQLQRALQIIRDVNGVQEARRN
jgi:GTP pyrophosphokinase